MALETYKRKRRFSRTSEPPGRIQRGSKRPIFVVQEHHASRLHYDFRLEADGVLKSWAVPKGPSLNPADKRLAVQTEDHPMEYATFKGDIPAGEYGAGHVDVWDKGTYENVMQTKPRPMSLTESIGAGHVEVDLHGRKLHGKFALVRTRPGSGGKSTWLLMKMKDQYAMRSDGAVASGAETEASAAGDRTKAVRRSGRSASAKARVIPPRGPVQMPEFTHVEKLMFPEAKLSKGDVLRYYIEVAGRLLPYLKDRPVTLERLPDGVGEGRPHFWQKNTPAQYPKWIPRVVIPTEAGKPVNHVLVNDVETLAYLVNQGALTFHVNFSRIGDLQRPDFVLFDLDPGEARFQDAVRIAREIHASLNPLDIPAYVKTSGRRGLHVMTPWRQAGGFTEARTWALSIAQQVVDRLQSIATTERSIRKRGRRVYVDVMQNALGHHAVPPYVMRATPEATVSTPLQWRELTAKLDPGKLDVRTVMRRFFSADPMAHLLSGWQD